MRPEMGAKFFLVCTSLALSRGLERRAQKSRAVEKRAMQTGSEPRLCHEPAYVTPGNLLQLSLHFLPQKRKTEWVLSSVLKHLIHSHALKSGSLLHQIHFKDESCLGCMRQGEIEKKFKIVIFHRSKWATKVLSIALHEVNTNNLYLFKAVFF